MKHEIKDFKTQDGRTIPVVKKTKYPRKGGAPGGTGVCLSAVGSYFGVTPDTYHHLWSYRTGEGLLMSRIRRNGFSVKTMTNDWIPHIKTIKSLQDNLANWGHITDDQKVIFITRNHIGVLCGDGSVACDTKYRPKAHIKKVFLVTKK